MIQRLKHWRAKPGLSDPRRDGHGNLCLLHDGDNIAGLGFQGTPPLTLLRHVLISGGRT
jgi:hypothetical protein